MQDELKATLRCANQAFEAGMRAGQQEATPKWRPIETAPRNESVLIFIPNAEHYGPGIYRGMLVDMGTGPHWSANALHMGRDCGPYYQPTHWMPLPTPPEEPK